MTEPAERVGVRPEALNLGAGLRPLYPRVADQAT